MTETVHLRAATGARTAPGNLATRGPAQDEPIFIVGAPRSGTTLLAAILASHSRICCGQETHFFSKLGNGAIEDALNDPDWPGKATALLASLELSGQVVHELYGVSTEEISDYLVSRPRTRRSMLESITCNYARRLEKPRWAEKTPNHLLHLNEIRATFPDACIVRIVRDPRDVALSMQALPWASKSTLANAYLWNEWYDRSRDFFERDRRSYTIQYEDLVQAPQRSIERLCGFLGEAFETEMVEPARSSKSVLSPREPWKRRVASPLDASRAYRWKRDMPEQHRLAVSQICFAGLQQFGYEAPLSPPKTTFLYPWPRNFAERAEKLIVDAAAMGVRVAPVYSTRFRQLAKSNFVFAGVPDYETSRRRKTRQSFRLLALLGVRRLIGRTNRYVAEHYRPDHEANRILWGAVRLAGRPWSPRDQSKDS